MKLSKLILFAVLINTTITSCYENQQGCLDNYAANYNFAADEECEEVCCTYPNLKFSFTHSFDTLTFVMKDTFVNNKGDAFIVLNQKFYFSDLSVFTNRDRVMLEKTENVTLRTGSNIELEVNYRLMRDVSATSIINQIKAIDTLERVKMTFGLNDYFNTNVNPNTVATNSDLSITNGTSDENERYYSYVAKIICGDALKDTVNVFTYNTYVIEKNLNPKIKQIPGSEILLNFNLNYANLFKDVDFRSADSLKMNAVLEKNIQFFVE